MMLRSTQFGQFGMVALRESIAVSILRTIKDGWSIVLSQKRSPLVRDEVLITEELRSSMREVLLRKDRPGHRTLVILPGTESMSVSQQKRPDGRTDIPILVNEVFQSVGIHDPHAIIECKLMFGSDSRRCREYVVNGIDRFKIGKYGSTHRIGFMVAYVVTGRATDSVRGVNRFLGRRMRDSETLRPSTLIPDRWARTSVHQRPAVRHDIELHHAHLEV